MNYYNDDRAIAAVRNFQLKKYLGKWYEIARIPHYFERSLDHVTAEYTLGEDQLIHVLNKGFRHGKAKSIRGFAKFKGSQDVGELQVSFFRPFWFPYRVIEVDEDYSLAIVTGRNRDFLWILAREPRISEDTLCRCMDLITDWEFDMEKLEFPDNS